VKSVDPNHQKAPGVVPKFERKVCRPRGNQFKADLEPEKPREVEGPIDVVNELADLLGKINT
jgi:hypothetical protein